MTLAILCSGQGLQHRAMFRLTQDAPAAQPIFEAARAQLKGRDPRVLTVEAPESELHGNDIAQVLCCTQALAAFAALGPAWPNRMVVAGYSVGEWAAWCCAGCLTPEQALSLVSQRASLMDGATGPDGGLAAVRGLSRTRIDALCHDHHASVAIINPGDLYIVGGLRDDLALLCTAAKALGAARANLLDVFTPSHTPLLQSAVAPLLAAFERSGTVSRPKAGIRLLSGLDGSSVRGTEPDRSDLARQVAHPLNWAATLQAVDEAGGLDILELGPGGALADMARFVNPGANARSLDDFNDLEGAMSWLNKNS